MEIETDLHPQFLEHFKSQLLYFEVRGSDIQVLFDGGGHQDRHDLMTQLVRRSFEDFPISKTIRFWVFTGDNRPANWINGQPLFSICGPRTQSDYVIPDPYSLRWHQAGVNDFHSYCESINQASKAKPTRMSAVWRGLISQNPVRKFVVDNSITLGDMFDLKNVTPDMASSDFINMNMLPEWAVLIDMPGHGFSGRLKYLLHANRPVVVFDRVDWDAATMCLEPGIHFFSCPPDISVFQHTVRKLISLNEQVISQSSCTVELIRKLTSRRYTSSVLVKRVLSGAG